MSTTMPTKNRHCSDDLLRFQAMTEALLDGDEHHVVGFPTLRVPIQFHARTLDRTAVVVTGVHLDLHVSREASV